MLRIFGSKVYISIFTLMLAAVITLSADAVFFYIALCGALMHEAAHLAAIKLCGAEIIKISVYPFGGDIKADTSKLSYRSEITVAAAGPLLNLLLFVLSVIFFAKYGGIYLLSFAVSNFMFFFVNIFPVHGLDGGRILLSFLLMRRDVSDAYVMYDRIAGTAFGVLCFFALLLLYLSGYNLSLFLVCAYLFFSGYIRQKCA